MELNELQRQSWAHEIAKGFHAGELFDGGEKQIGHFYSKIALTMSELAELTEAMRASTLKQECNKQGTNLSNAEEEIADAFIRLAGLAALLDIKDLDKAVQVKIDYNKTRPIKHGKNS